MTKLTSRSGAGAVISRAFLTILLSIGILWPVSVSLPIAPSIAVSAITTALTVLLLVLSGSLKRYKFIPFAIVAAYEIIANLFFSRTMLVKAAISVFETARMFISGNNTALLLLNSDFIIIISIIVTLIVYFYCDKGLGVYPTAIFLCAIYLALWFSGSHEFLPYTLPAIPALMVLYSRSAHDDTPMRHVLPVAVVLTAIAFLIVPQSGASNETLKNAAEDIRSYIEDTLLFSKERNVFSLQTEGYMPLDGRLGGKTELSDRPVMMVETPKRTLMRGTSKAFYTGLGWNDSLGGHRYLFSSLRYLNTRREILNEQLPRDEKLISDEYELTHINITIANHSTSTLFLPQRIRRLNTTWNMIPYFNESSEIFITRDLETGDTYQADAYIFTGDDGSMADILGAADDNATIPSDIMDIYLQLPAHMEQLVYDLAARITADCYTPYQKAVTISNYLKRRYTYTLEPADPPDNIDFVTYFLFEGREGYCTYFASAFTVLCRMAGLPARYIEGYAADPGTRGVAYVTGENAHAWSEVYFAGFGWVPFDPTPSTDTSGDDGDNSQSGNDDGDEPTPSPSPSPTPTPAPQESEEPTSTPSPDAETPEPDSNATPTPSPEADEPDSPDSDNNDDDKDSPNLSWLLWLLLILLLIAAIAARVYYTLPPNTAKKQSDEKDKLMIWYSAVMLALRLDGIAQSTGETLLGTLTRAEKLLPGVRNLAYSVYTASYTTRPITREMLSDAEGFYHAAVKSLGVFRRIKYASILAIKPLTPKYTAKTKDN
ncbi:MAG: transglutaminase-like domain-containing protein [Eubacteriales bacterium]|nr:transglutaminase-like domain-containing protein [Eubacteriales bacterium]MDD4512380.1 transglutaminase-like domain-containing protein [Eubacteriales bacterium]